MSGLAQRCKGTDARVLLCGGEVLLCGGAVWPCGVEVLLCGVVVSVLLSSWDTTCSLLELWHLWHMPLLGQGYFASPIQRPTLS
jgi:hypothetical protein